MHPLYTESERERGGGGIIPQGVARNLRNLVEHPGSSVDTRLVTNDFASIGVYIYISYVFEEESGEMDAQTRLGANY